MRKARVVAAACAVATLAACTPATSAPSSGPPSSAGTPTAAASESPAASLTPSPPIDLTEPGEARAALDRLVAAAGGDAVLMVALTSQDASVTVLRGGAAETWALRGGEPRRVESDATYVAQATVDLAAFDVSDVGALFRAAAAVSGSDQRQELQIVDYSAGLVMMTVSTNPESRTVFFRPDGSLLPTLDFDTKWGLAEGYADAVGGLRSVLAVGFGSALGVYADLPGPQDGTVLRRQRTARVPVVVSSRSDPGPPPPFDPGQLDTAVVWGVIDAQRRQGALAPGAEWSCVADDRDRRGAPRLHCQVGAERITTDLSGQRVDG